MQKYGAEYILNGVGVEGWFEVVCPRLRGIFHRTGPVITPPIGLGSCPAVCLMTGFLPFSIGTHGMDGIKFGMTFPSGSLHLRAKVISWSFFIYHHYCHFHIKFVSRNSRKCFWSYRLEFCRFVCLALRWRHMSVMAFKSPENSTAFSSDNSKLARTISKLRMLFFCERNPSRIVVPWWKTWVETINELLNSYVAWILLHWLNLPSFKSQAIDDKKKTMYCLALRSQSWIFRKQVLGHWKDLFKLFAGGWV